MTNCIIVGDTNYNAELTANNSASGAALYVDDTGLGAAGIAEYGTFVGGNFYTTDSFVTIPGVGYFEDNTIEVVNGELY